MCITEDKLVKSYGKATPRERFRLIYNQVETQGSVYDNRGILVL